MKRLLRNVCLLLLPVFLAACAGSSARKLTIADLDVVGRDDSFAVVRLKRGQTAADVADVFLGSRRELWQLEEINGTQAMLPGQLVAVPLKPVNPSGVYASWYRILPILCYHQFTPGKSAAHKLELTARDFEEQISFLVNNGYVALSFAEVAEIMHSGRPIPDRSVVLTIDDGYASVYEVAWPILKKYGVKATLFIYTDFIGAGAALSWDQMQEMQASGLIEIQSHAKSHVSLSRLPSDATDSDYEARLKAELEGSEAAFRQHMGTAPAFLSYPYGNSSRTIAGMLRKSGYQLAATVTRGNNGSFADPYLLHRTMIYDGHTLRDFQRFINGYRSRRQP